jgi:hypothetical protein
MFKERDERCRNGGNLVGGYIHQVYLLPFNKRVIGKVADFNPVGYNKSGLVDRCGSLGNDLVFFFLGAEVNSFRKVNLTVDYTFVRGFDET